MEKSESKLVRKEERKFSLVSLDYIKVVSPTDASTSFFLSTNFLMLYSTHFVRFHFVDSDPGELEKE